MQIYDDSKKKIGTLTDFKDRKIVYTLDTGDKELSFKYQARGKKTNLLKELQTGQNCIISCGGGVALRQENVVEMKKNGRVVLLTASPETIFERVKDSNDRPILDGNKNVEFIAGLMEQRREKYEAAADVVVQTDNKTILQICEELISKLMELDGK